MRGDGGQQWRIKKSQQNCPLSFTVQLYETEIETTQDVCTSCCQRGDESDNRSVDKTSNRFVSSKNR